MITGDFEPLDVDTEALAVEEGVLCEFCGNVSENQDGICGDCLSAARERDRKAQYEEYAKYLGEVLP